MGDRCCCELRLVGTITDEDLQRLTRRLEETGERTGESTFSFEEVNYAQFEEADLLEPYALSWIWHNYAGDDYTEGVQCYDFETDTSMEEMMVNGQLVLLFDDVAKQDRIEHLTAWNAWMKGAKLHILKTAHEKLEHRLRLEALVESGRIDPIEDGEDG